MGFFQDLFGGKKPEAQQPKVTTPQNIFGLDELLAQARGRQIGFGTDFIERGTAPYIASREARFAEEEAPFIEGQFGDRGLGRSSLVARDLGKAFATKERDINELLAQAALENEQQKKLDLARQFQELGGISSAQTAQQNLRSAAEERNAVRQREIDASRALADTNMARGITGSGLSLLGAATGSPVLASFGGNMAFGTSGGDYTAEGVAAALKRRGIDTPSFFTKNIRNMVAGRTDPIRQIANMVTGNPQSAIKL